MEIEQGGGSAAARKKLRLLVARGELAEARAERMMRSCAAGAVEVRNSNTDPATLDRHAWRTGTLLEAERMLQSDLPDEVDLGATFERYATLFLISSGVMTELRTSFGRILVGGEVCRWIMMVATELLHVVETSADAAVGCTAHVVIDHAARGIVLTVVAVGGADRPVPSRSGAGALARTNRLMELFGGLSTSVRAGDIVYEAVFDGGRASAAS